MVKIFRPKIAGDDVFLDAGVTMQPSGCQTLRVAACSGCVLRPLSAALSSRYAGRVRISLGDVALWFEVSGPSVLPRGDTTAERPVLVAVHSGPGLDHIDMKDGLAPLAEDLQALYYDQRGHGRSDHSSAEFWNLRT